jgi:hypothetical protein
LLWVQCNTNSIVLLKKLSTSCWFFLQTFDLIWRCRVYCVDEADINVKCWGEYETHDACVWLHKAYSANMTG